MKSSFKPLSTVGNKNTALYEICYEDGPFEKVLALIEADSLSFKISITPIENLRLYTELMTQSNPFDSIKQRTFSELTRFQLCASKVTGPNYVSIHMPITQKFSDPNFTNFCATSSTQFIDSILSKSIQQGFMVYLTPSSEPNSTIFLEEYLDQHDLRLTFFNKIRVPYPEQFHPEKNIFDDLMDANKFLYNN
jgi:hypothetical protein